MVLRRMVVRRLAIVCWHSLLIGGLSGSEWSVGMGCGNADCCAQGRAGRCAWKSKGRCARCVAAAAICLLPALQWATDALVLNSREPGASALDWLGVCRKHISAIGVLAIN